MSADLLRRAAAKIRKTAQAATAEPWMKDPDDPGIVLKPDAPGGWDGTIVATVQRDDYGLVEEGTTEHIALWSPDVAELVASILYAAVDRYYNLRRDDIELRTYGLTDEQAQAALRHEFALARHILREGE